MVDNDSLKTALGISVSVIAEYYGYKILKDGVVENDQPHKPGVPGIVMMTETEANNFADEIVKVKNNPPTSTPHH